MRLGASARRIQHQLGADASHGVLPESMSDTGSASVPTARLRAAKMEPESVEQPAGLDKVTPAA